MYTFAHSQLSRLYIYIAIFNYEIKPLQYERHISLLNEASYMYCSQSNVTVNLQKKKKTLFGNSNTADFVDPTNQPLRYTFYVDRILECGFILHQQCIYSDHIELLIKCQLSI